MCVQYQEGYLEYRWGWGEGGGDGGGKEYMVVYSSSKNPDTRLVTVQRQ